MATSEGEAYDEEGGGGPGPGGDPTEKFVWTYFGDQGFIEPTQSEWPTSVSAPSAPDGANNAVGVREFVDDAVTGVGLNFTVPASAVNVKVRFKGRGAGTIGDVIPLMSGRSLGDNAAPDAFSANKVFAALVYTADNNWRDDEETVTIASLGLTAGEDGQIFYSRDKVGQGGDTLVGLFRLARVQLVFST